jgi:integrase
MWLNRKTIIYEIDQLPFDEDGNLKIDDPATVRLKIPGYIYPVDIGSICYAKKKRLTLNTASEELSVYLVEAASYKISRVHLVKSFLEFLSQYIYLGRSKNSIRSIYYEFVSFVNWCDLNMQDGLDNQVLIRDAYIKYSDNLLEKVKHNTIKYQTAYSSQRTVRVILTWIFKEVNNRFLEGVRVIKKSNNHLSSIEPPSESDAKKALSLYQTLFSRLSKFVVDFEHYPIKLKLEVGNYWLFPNEVPFIFESNDALKTGRFISYNYHQNRLNTFDEIFQKLRNINPKSHRRNAWKALKNAKSKLQSANFDKFHLRRILVATLAQQSFIMLFLANTGMNLSQARSLKWDCDEYEVKIERLGFKTIKCRAGNKDVQFFVSSDFFPIFKKYLQLRRYLIEAHQGKNSKNLFFTSQRGELNQINMNFSTNINMRLNRLFDFNININTREWRAYKSDWLIRNTDIATTAMVLQNTTDTVIKHYIAGSEVTAGLEFTNFFKALNQKLIIEFKDTSDSILLGQCTSVNNPMSILVGETKFTPACNKPEGCLFCANYAVHSDEIDIRKLLSYRYVLEQCRVLSDSDEHFEKLFSPVLIRINYILEEIAYVRKDMGKLIEKIKKEVHEHEALSQYWIKKLNMLIDLEII